MKVPFSWLKDFVDIDVTPVELADKMVKAGFEVEEIINLADFCKKVVVGHILQIEKHPDADKLVVCKIDCGEHGEKQIVTAATNVHVGDYVPVSLHGALLPSGQSISKGKLRGVLSEGMLCGGEELGLTGDDYPNAGVYGIFILEEAQPGMDINEYLDNNDYILDIGVTANRPDCNSIIGIAREVAAVLDRPLKPLHIAEFKEEGDISDYVDVSVLDEELCPRYMAKAVKDVKIGISPVLIRRRLRKVGIRPINNVVDITNYVLTEVGQPMHSFDADCIGGKHIIVRRAEEGEHIVTLDGKDNVLSHDNLVICDSNKPVALAGIMGGENSGISESTKNVVFESARFKRDNIRRSSKALGIRSDSSARFEKGIDFGSQELAILRACTLMQELGVGTIVGGCKDSFKGVEPRVLKVSVQKIDEILGIKVPRNLMVGYLTRLLGSCELIDDELVMTVPEYREDLVNANDVAEEIIRMYGYDNIVGTPLDGFCQTHGGKNQKQRNEYSLKVLLSSCGYNECVSYSFISPSFANKLNLPEDEEKRKYIELLNPLGEELSVMRTTLLPSMLNLISINTTRGNKDLALYEIGKVYIPKSLPINDYADERDTLMMAMSGEGKDFFTLKQGLETVASKFNVTFTYKKESYSYLHPGRCASVYLNDVLVGYIGELHPDVCKSYKFDQRIYVAEISLAEIYENAKEALAFVEIPRFPAITRDLAFVLDREIESFSLLQVVKKAGGRLLESAEIFDVYQGKGIPSDKKSIAIALAFRTKDRTLTDDEVNAVIKKILTEAEKQLGAVLR